MAQIGQRSELVLEAIQAVLVEVAQELERHGDAALAVEHLIDHAHPARTDSALDIESLGPREFLGEVGQAGPRSILSVGSSLYQRGDRDRCWKRSSYTFWRDAPA